VASPPSLVAQYLIYHGFSTKPEDWSIKRR
jgi:hypothetical protein